MKFFESKKTTTILLLSIFAAILFIVIVNLIICCVNNSKTTKTDENPVIEVEQPKYYAENLIKVVDGDFILNLSQLVEKDYACVIDMNGNLKPLNFKNTYYAKVSNVLVNGKNILVEVSEQEYQESLEIFLAYSLSGKEIKIPINLEFTSEITQMDILNMQYELALKKGDWAEVSRIIEEIIELQNRNGVSISITNR